MLDTINQIDLISMFVGMVLMLLFIFFLAMLKRFKKKKIYNFNNVKENVHQAGLATLASYSHIKELERFFKEAEKG